MTDHEGIQASQHPKLAEVNIDEANREIDHLIDETGKLIVYASIAGVVLAIAVVLVVIYAQEIDAWRIAL